MKYRTVKAKKEFEKILKHGKRAYSDALTIVYLENKELKMAVCVGKKFGKSVQRNAIKRLLREAFRVYCEDMRSCAVLLIPRVKEEYSYRGYVRDMGKIFAKERLLEG